MLCDPLEASIMHHYWLLGHVACFFGQEDPVQESYSWVLDNDAPTFTVTSAAG